MFVMVGIRNLADEQNFLCSVCSFPGAALLPIPPLAHPESPASPVTFLAGPTELPASKLSRMPVSATSPALPGRSSGDSCSGECSCGGGSSKPSGLLALSSQSPASHFDICSYPNNSLGLGFSFSAFVFGSFRSGVRLSCGVRQSRNSNNGRNVVVAR
jgi:hypothetical protein